MPPSSVARLDEDFGRVDLNAFLEKMAATPFVDGQSDCVLTVADWIVMNGHPDPAAPYRGRYRTALGRERLLKRNCGLHALMADGAIRAGLRPALAPGRGDVGTLRHGGQVLAGICLGSRWAVKGNGLTVAVADEVLAAWSV